MLQAWNYPRSKKGNFHRSSRQWSKPAAPLASLTAYLQAQADEEERLRAKSASSISQASASGALLAPPSPTMPSSSWGSNGKRSPVEFAEMIRQGDSLPDVLLAEAISCNRDPWTREHVVILQIAATILNTSNMGMKARAHLMGTGVQTASIERNMNRHVLRLTTAANMATSAGLLADAELMVAAAEALFTNKIHSRVAVARTMLDLHNPSANSSPTRI